MATPMPPQPPRSHVSGMAIAGFVCSFFCGLLGLIFSIMGRNEIKRSGGAIQGGGLALAGMIISIVSLVLGLLGILAAIAIPAFVEYNMKSKRSEHDLELHRIERSVRMYAIEHAELPRMSAPLTPATSCCESPTRKCDDLRAWDSEAWRAIDFQIDRPHLFQYSYESDGTTFVARAVGDLDCDGDTVTYELQARLVDGVPSFSKLGPIGRD